MNWRVSIRGEIAAILLVAALLGAILLASIEFPNFSWYSMTNRGFGPGWECTNPGVGEAICIKNPSAKAEKSN
ncbi:MAG: hypothetical protein ACJ8FM_10370 [Xanthobacteraceae bacterium]